MPRETEGLEAIKVKEHWLFHVLTVLHTNEHTQ